ncbi:thiol-activated cytolysin C-terminal domain-containing protein, partial [Bacillus sp. B-TM1]
MSFVNGTFCSLKIVARECTGLAWEWWRTIIN